MSPVPPDELIYGDGLLHEEGGERAMRYHEHTPLHYLEGIASEWQRWFAWRPVKTEQGRWVWLRRTWRRRFTPPVWFCPPAPFNGWIEYSDERLGYWELAVPPPLCADCGKNRADPPSRLCPGCEAYREHTA